MSLRKKYFLIFFALFVSLSLVMTMTAYLLSNHILIKKYEEMSLENLTYLLEITDNEIEQMVNTISFASNDSLIHRRILTEYTEEDTYKKLLDDKAVTSVFHALSAFDVFDAMDILYFRGLGGEEYWYGSGMEFLDRVEMLKGIDSDELVTLGLGYYGIMESKNPYTSSDRVLRFSKGLADDEGMIAGLIYFELDTNFFKNLYRGDHLLPGTSLYLVDEEGYCIYHENPEMIGSLLTFDSESSIYVEKTMERYGWRLISETDQNYILDESQLIINVTLMMAAASILVAMLVIFYITGRITKPIKKLSHAMTKVQQGDMTVQVNHRSQDEIGLLTDNFNEMTLKLKENLEKERAYTKAMNDAEYKALQAQINPHFMYNALNALKWLAGIQKADNIIELVDALWKLLRKTSSLKGQFVTLQQEIEIIEAYAAIQQVRYKGKFDVFYNVSEDHRAVVVPKFILQPFVENAIFHGVEPKKGPGVIELSTVECEGCLCIGVRDDGVGIEQDKIGAILTDPSVQQHSAGLNNIGVKNVDERLKLLFGPNSRVVIESEVGVGTKVSIKIPIKDQGRSGAHV